jgi:hypothetical protein
LVRQYAHPSHSPVWIALVQLVSLHSRFERRAIAARINEQVGGAVDVDVGNQPRIIMPSREMSADRAKAVGTGAAPKVAE